MVYLRDTLDMRGVIDREDEIFGNHTVGERPWIIGSVDVVGIDVGGVAAAVRERGSVSAGNQIDGLPAVGDVQNGVVDIIDTMDN